MFDPTVFENLKVVVEGSVYDLDLAGCIVVTDRKDTVDLASMSRMYMLSFRLNELGPHAVFMLRADVKNLAGEILETPSVTPGCSIQLQFVLPMTRPEDCAEIEQLVRSIWGKERMITQHISYEYNKQPLSYVNTITILFEKTITEDHVDDLSAVVDHMVETLQSLEKQV